MATNVVQYTSPDPSLSAFANFGQFVQYLITGTNYILDNMGQIVYEFDPNRLGVLENTGGSYAQFLGYLQANPVTRTLPNPNGPIGGPATFGFPYVFQSVPGLPSACTSSVYDERLYELMENLLLEVRCMRLASVKLATEGGGATEGDFDPTVNLGFGGSYGVSFS